MMVQKYKDWAEFAFPEIVNVAQYVANIPKTDDPAENYRTRGAPFARLFKRLSVEYRARKLAQKVLPPPPVPAPPPTIRVVG